MTVTVHSASTERALINKLTWRECPLCGHDSIRICATPSYVAIACDNIKDCALEYYTAGNVETVNKRWNLRRLTQ